MLSGKYSLALPQNVKSHTPKHTVLHPIVSHPKRPESSYLSQNKNSQHIKNYSIINRAEIHLTLLLLSKASFKRTFCFFAPNTTFLHFPSNISTCNRSSSAKFGSALLSSFCDVLSMLETFGCSVSTSS